MIEDSNVAKETTPDKSPSDSPEKTSKVDEKPEEEELVESSSQPEQLSEKAEADLMKTPTGQFKKDGFASFEDKDKGETFMANIEDYTELDFFEYENRMRKQIQTVLDPVLQQATKDRHNLRLMFTELEEAKNRLQGVEDILFQKQDTGKFEIFERIWENIRENDDTRIIEQAKIQSEVNVLDHKITHLMSIDDNYEKQLRGQEKIIMDMSQTMEKQARRFTDWQEEFTAAMDDYKHKALLRMDDVKQKVDQHNDRLNILEKFQTDIDGWRKRETELMAQAEKDIRSLYERTEALKNNKVSVNDHEVDVKKIDEELERMKYEAENHANHFAMVENFVEKYIPVRIQSMISQTLQQVLPYKECQSLASYEKVKFNELHQQILDDDGLPDLIKMLRQIRFDITNIDFDNYQGIVLASQRVKRNGQQEERLPIPDDSMQSGSKRGGSTDSRMQSMRSSGEEISSSDNRRSTSTHNPRQPHPLQKTMRQIEQDAILQKKNTKLQSQHQKQFNRQIQHVKSFVQKKKGIATMIDQQNRSFDSQRDHSTNERDPAEIPERKLFQELGGASRRQSDKLGREHRLESTEVLTKSTHNLNHEPVVVSKVRKQAKTRPSGLNSRPSQSQFASNSKRHGSTETPADSAAVARLEEQLLATNKVVNWLEKKSQELQAHIERLEFIQIHKISNDVKDAETKLKKEQVEHEKKMKSQINELQLYTADLHKEIQLFMEKKKVEIQGKFLELQDCLREVRFIKEGLSESKTQEGSLALIVACLVEIEKLKQASGKQFDCFEGARHSEQKHSSQNFKQGHAAGQPQEFSSLRKDLKFMKLRLASRTGHQVFGAKKPSGRNSKLLLKQPAFQSNQDLLQVRSRQDLLDSAKATRTFDRIPGSIIGNNPYQQPNTLDGIKIQRKPESSGNSRNLPEVFGKPNSKSMSTLKLSAIPTKTQQTDQESSNQNLDTGRTQEGEGGDETSYKDNQGVTSQPTELSARQKSTQISFGRQQSQQHIRGVDCQFTVADPKAALKVHQPLPQPSSTSAEESFSYHGRQISTTIARGEVHLDQILSVLLQKCSNVIEDEGLFREHNLGGQRIFNDVVQYLSYHRRKESNNGGSGVKQQHVLYSMNQTAAVKLDRSESAVQELSESLTLRRPGPKLEIQLQKQSRDKQELRQKFAKAKGSLHIDGVSHKSEEPDTVTLPFRSSSVHNISEFEMRRNTTQNNSFAGQFYPPQPGSANQYENMPQKWA